MPGEVTLTPVNVADVVPPLVETATVAKLVPSIVSVMLPLGDCVPAGGVLTVRAAVTLNATFTLGERVEGVTVVVVELSATLTVEPWELAEA